MTTPATQKKRKLALTLAVAAVLIVLVAVIVSRMGFDKDFVYIRTDTLPKMQIRVPSAHQSRDSFLFSGLTKRHCVAALQVTFQHNTVLLYGQQFPNGGGLSGAITVYSDFGHAQNTTIVDNLVSGGAYVIYGG